MTAILPAARACEATPATRTPANATIPRRNFVFLATRSSPANSARRWRPKLASRPQSATDLVKRAALGEIARYERFASSRARRPHDFRQGGALRRARHRAQALFARLHTSTP